MSWDFNFSAPPPDARLIRTEVSGRQVWRWRGMFYYSDSQPVAPITTADLQGGPYHPVCGRKAAYGKRQDWRNTRWFAEAVRERRQIVQTNYRAVKPGPQRMQ